MFWAMCVKMLGNGILLSPLSNVIMLWWENAMAAKVTGNINLYAAILNMFNRLRQVFKHSVGYSGSFYVHSDKKSIIEIFHLN